MPTTKIFIPVDSAKIASIPDFDLLEGKPINRRMSFDVSKNLVRGSLLKGDIAVLDIIASNIWKRPIYFAVTCRSKSLLGLDNYLQLEGLGLKLVPYTGKSDKAYGMVGKGLVHADRIYDNVINKFKWGNLDKVEQFVDHSFGPSIQSHSLLFLRTTQEFLAKKQNDKAVALIDKYFESFPHKNFKYEYVSTFPFIQMYMEANAYEKAKPHIKIFAEETADHLDFYYSLNDEARSTPEFSRKLQMAQAAMSGLTNLVKSTNDQEMLSYLDGLFQPFKFDELKK